MLSKPDITEQCSGISLGPSAIFLSDMHLTLKRPKARTDDFVSALITKVLFINEVQRQLNVPILVPGDIFDEPQVPQGLEAWAISNLSKKMIMIPGQHDLPNHLLELFNKSSLAVLEAAGFTVLSHLKRPLIVDDFEIHCFPYGVKPTNCTKELKPPLKRRLALAHFFTYKGNTPWPGCEAPTAKQLLRQLSGFDIIVTGDNHKPFVEEYEGRILVNPGSIMRLKADQEFHQPRIYVWNSNTNEVQRLNLPINQDVITREHLDKEEENQSNLSSFISTLHGEKDICRKFEDNLKIFFDKKRIHKKVQDEVWEAVDSCKTSLTG
jgi:DNA repair exonuclease SbcCD nuclease subunit